MIVGEIIAGSVDQAALEGSDPYQYLKMMMFLENGIFGVIENGRGISKQK